MPNLTCNLCGKIMMRTHQSLPQGKARCHPCRRANPATPRPAERSPRLTGWRTCTECAKRMRTWLATKAPRCRPCRSRMAKPDRAGTPCIDCGKPSFGVRCKPCDIARRANPNAPELRRMLNRRRAERDRLAPGMYNLTQRRKLLDKWRRQGKTCTYCDAPVATVDHIIPLALGGTNHEGNMAPACVACNQSKMDNLLSAWRYGIRVHKWRVDVGPLPPRDPKPRSKPKPAKQVVLNACVICNGLTLNAKHCSDECRVERNRRIQRDIYRARVGLPVEPTVPTSKWLGAKQRQRRGRVSKDLAA